jgi:hypothetical protein
VLAIRTLDIDYGDADRTRRLNFAAAMCDMSAAAFIRASIDQVIEGMAQKDHWFGAFLAEQSRKSRRK